MAERVRMSPQEGKEKVAALRRIVLDTYERTIKDQPFFVELRAGTLPRAKLKGWVTNWYAFALEVNTGMATAYHQFVGFFKRHPECEDLIAQKIGEEFTTPAIGGHARMLPVLGKALGVEAHEMIEAQLIPETRGLVDFFVRSFACMRKRISASKAAPIRSSCKKPSKMATARTRRLAAGILRTRRPGNGRAVFSKACTGGIRIPWYLTMLFCEPRSEYFFSKFTLSRSTGVFDSNTIKSLERRRRMSF